MTANDRPTLRQKARTYLGEGWSTHRPADFERYHATREKRARKIRTLLREAGALPAMDGVILDVGCSSGEMIRYLSSEAALCIGMDMDASAGISPSGNVVFTQADGEAVPLVDGSVDVVICNHIYEHTDDPQRLIDEIWRVLRPSGHCYFAGPNRWELVEPHYGLPFLSWLPRSLADRYMRITGRGPHYLERPLSRKALLRMLGSFDVESCAERIVLEPARYDSDDLLPPGSLRQKLALLVSRITPGAMPGFIFLCRKPRTAD